MLLKMTSKGQQREMRNLAKALRKKTNTRQGVRKGGLYGFPTLSQDYVKRIRMNLLLWVDDDLKSSNTLPARRKPDQQPVIQVELEPQIIKGNKLHTHTGSACMKILPNSSKYKMGEMKAKPIQGMETTVSEKQSSELLLKSNDMAQQMRKTNSPGRIQEATMSLTSSFKLINKAGDEEVRSDMSDDGGNSVKENIDVAQMKEEIKVEELKHQTEEEAILDAVLEEWMELNPENKVEIAQRKISVHQPVVSAHKRFDLPLLQKGFSALGLKEGLVPPLMADKGLESLRLLAYKSGRKQVSKFKPDKGQQSGSRLGTEGHSDDAQTSEGDLELRREKSEQFDRNDEFVRSSNLSIQSSNDRSRKNSAHYEITPLKSTLTMKEEEKNQSKEETKQKLKERSRKAFKFLNSYVTRLKKVPREQKLSTLHQSLKSILHAGKEQTTTPQDQIQLPQVHQNEETSEDQEKESSREVNSDDEDFFERDLNHRLSDIKDSKPSRKESVTNLSGQFYTKMTEVLAEMLKTTGSKAELQRQPTQKFRKFSEKLVDEMEWNHHFQITQTPVNKSSTESLSIVYDEQYDELEADVENTIERASSRESLIVEQGNSPHFSKELNLMYKLAPNKHGYEEDMANNNFSSYSFKLKLEKISSSNLLSSQDANRIKNAASYRSAEVNQHTQENEWPVYQQRNSERGSSTLLINQAVRDEEEERKDLRRHMDRDKRASLPKVGNYPPLYNYRDGWWRQQSYHTRPNELTTSYSSEDKILDTEKNFKLNILKAETARSESTLSDEELAQWRAQLKIEPNSDEKEKRKSSVIKMCQKARRNTKDWRKWYKFE